ncbi:MAG: type IV pilus assembly protein PilM [Candidatus Omnitrophica bacterium]|nr:type IV pilus assembly protein PilM [Candidatus Omnitrophota bacterium]MBU1933103.1 type IV pilus assembly protein PilM [Candidatus Omnitrophota bacterium]
MKKQTLFQRPLFHTLLLDNLKTCLKSIGVVTGLDIGASSLKIVELKKTREGFSVNNFVFDVIPASVRADDKELAQFIINSIREAVRQDKLMTRGGFLALSGKEVKIFSLTFPKIARRDLKNAIPLEIKKQMVFDPKKSFFDFQVSSEFSDRTGPKLQIIAAVADRNVVQEKIDILQKAGIRPLGISIIPNALGSVLERISGINPEEVVSVLDMGAKFTALCIFKGSKLEFSRDIPVGGDHLTQGLVRKITLPDREINITLEQAEIIKKECGIPRKEELEQSVGPLSKSHILAIMKPTLERLTSDILRSINYYRQYFKIPKIDRLLLSGGGSRLKNIEEFLSTNLKDIKVDRLNPLATVAVWTDKGVSNQELLEELAPHLSVGFGLAFGKKGAKVDLLPFETRLQQKVETVKFILKTTVPVVTAVIFLLYVAFSAQSSHYRRLITQAKASLESFESTRQSINEYDALKERMEQRKNLLEKAVGRQPLWRGVLKELGRVGPEGITLHRLAVVKGQSPIKLRLNGEIVPSYTSIDLVLSQYLMALDESPFFENVELVSQVRDAYSSTPKARFEIMLKLVY